ncbi:MAG: nitrite reductase small subunit NirD [Mariprofundales bacterium]|nr:nitrite reductase small subunit NirD [Mariprofundales bacterium]
MSNQPMWYTVCSVDEVPLRGGRLIRAGITQIALFRLSNGKIRAIDNRCPHKQGPLAEGIISNDTIICPLHARKIDLESGNVLPPDTGCVTTYPTKIEDGQVQVQW